MSKITEVTYSKGQTIQAKQFEPVNFHYSAKAEVNEQDKLEEVYANLEKLIDHLIERKVKMFEGTKSQQIKAINEPLAF